MRYLIVGLLVFVTGCAAVDSFFGTNDKGEAVIDGGSAPSDFVGRTADYFLPGSAAAIGLLSTFWASIRGRRWKRVAATVIDAVDTARELKTDSGTIDIKELLRILHDKQVQVTGVHELAKTLREK